MRRAYVASSTNNVDVVRDVQKMLEERGVEITFDWTKVVEEFGDQSDGPNPNQVIRRESAYNDMRGVMECDAFILCEYPGMCGAYIEFGMAAMSEEIDIILMGT